MLLGASPRPPRSPRLTWGTRPRPALPLSRCRFRGGELPTNPTPTPPALGRSNAHPPCLRARGQAGGGRLLTRRRRGAGGATRARRQRTISPIPGGSPWEVCNVQTQPAHLPRQVPRTQPHGRMKAALMCQPEGSREEGRQRTCELQRPGKQEQAQEPGARERVRHGGRLSTGASLAVFLFCLKFTGGDGLLATTVPL